MSMPVSVSVSMSMSVSVYVILNACICVRVFVWSARMDECIVVCTLVVLPCTHDGKHKTWRKRRKRVAHTDLPCTVGAPFAFLCRSMMWIPRIPFPSSRGIPREMNAKIPAKIPRHLHRCRLFGRLALTDRSVGPGRYRRSVRFHLRDNTVDIDGRFGYTY